MENNYTGIQHHEGLLGIRNHPAMYVGSTNKVSEKHAPKALTQLAQEVLSNSVDEFVAGYGEEISITIHEDNSITIIDNGRGLPKGVDNTFEDVYVSTTKLHASGKFENGAYASTNTAGMHGIGLKAANALSKYLEIKAISHATTFKKDKKVLTGDLVEWRIKLCRETILEKEIIKTYKQKDLTKINNFTYQLKNGEIIKTGTTVHFLPDNDPISDTDPRPTLESIEWVNSDLYPKLESTAFLNPSLKIIFKDDRKEENNVKEWNYKNGIVDYVKRVSKDYDKLEFFKEPIYFESVFPIEKEEYFTFNVALTYVDDMSSMIDSYANGLRTVDGGHHFDGFIQAVVKCINDFAKNQKLIKGNELLLQSDVTDGLISCITMGVPKSLIQFESQTKEKLGTTKAKEVATKITYENLTNYLYDHIEIGKSLVQRMLESKYAREKAIASRKESKANRNKKKGLSLEISTKLKSATSNNPEEKELILGEGNSAVNMDRDIKTQAILALRGKITNLNKVKQSELDKIVKGNLEISTIVETIGAGYGKHFNIDEMKYSRVILACFTGDTEVKSLDGNSYSFKYLVDNRIDSLWVYSMDKDGNVIPTLANNIKKIKDVNKLVRITLDNGEKITSTLDHKFLLPNLQYCEAQNLEIGQSLMPLYTKDVNGYEEYFNRSTNKWEKTHKLVGNTLLKEEKENALIRLSEEIDVPKKLNGIHLHHKSIFKPNNKRDNRPCNLQWLTGLEHLKTHAKANNSKDAKEYYSKLHKDGKLKSFKDTYNGTEKHKADIKKAWENGKYPPSHFITYNKTNANRLSCLKSNRNPLHILHGQQTKILYSFKYLIDNNIPINEKNYEENRFVGAVMFEKILNYFSSIDEIISKSANVNYIKYIKNKDTPRNVILNQKSRFVTILKRLISQNIIVTKESYNEVRDKSRKEPTFEKLFDYFDSVEEAVEFSKNYNHTITNIEFIETKSEPVYCLTVPKYHNFALSSGVFVHNCDAVDK